MTNQDLKKFQPLTKSEMRTTVAGMTEPECLGIGASCTENLDCCSVNCAGSSDAESKSCAVS